tara:strand:+ start:114 stop:473 length:360 start_codon:yes stop_codon:yes gene_type:complete
MPRLTNKTRQYLFKKKLFLRRKSKIQLIKESFLMMLFGIFLLVINYFIPEKLELFNSFKKNIIDIFFKVLEIVHLSIDLLIVLFIICTTFFSLFLIVGSLNRFIKVILPKSRKINIQNN